MVPNSSKIRETTNDHPRFRFSSHVPTLLHILSEDYPNVTEVADEVPPGEALLVEYQEVGAEWRNYEKLLNQSYYLSAIVFTFFAGAMANLYNQEADGLAALLGLFAFLVFLVLGTTGKAYHQRRQAASELRTKIAEQLHELTNSKVPRIQKVVVGGGNTEIEEREANSNELLWRFIPLYRLAFITSIGWLLVAGYLWIFPV